MQPKPPASQRAEQPVERPTRRKHPLLLLLSIGMLLAWLVFLSLMAWRG